MNTMDSTTAPAQQPVALPEPARITEARALLAEALRLRGAGVNDAWRLVALALRALEGR